MVRWSAVGLVVAILLAGCTYPFSSASPSDGNSPPVVPDDAATPPPPHEAIPVPLAGEVGAWDCEAPDVPFGSCIDAALVAFSARNTCNAHVVDGATPACVGPLGADYSRSSYCPDAGSCAVRSVEVVGEFGSVVVEGVDSIKVQGPAQTVSLGSKSGNERLSVYVGDADSVDALAEGHGQAVVIGRIGTAFVSGDGGGGAAAFFQGAAGSITLSEHRSDAPVKLTAFVGKARFDRGGVEVTGAAGSMSGQAVDIQFTGSLTTADLVAWGHGGSAITIKGAPRDGADWTLKADDVNLEGRGDCTLDLDLSGSLQRTKDGWHLEGSGSHFTSRAAACEAHLDLNARFLTLIA